MNDQMRPLRWQNNPLNVGIFIIPMDYDWKNNILFANGGTSAGTNVNFIGMVPIGDEDTDPWAVQLTTHTIVPFSSLKWDENSTEEECILFLGTQSGRVFKTINPQADYEVYDLTREELPNAYVSCIEIGQSTDTLLVTLSNYGVESVWMTTDGGENWRDIEGNLPDMPVRWGLFHPESSKHVMLATETGIWTSDNVLDDEVYWKPNSRGLANVRVDMLRMRKSDKKVVAASHGRGLFTTEWELTDLSSLEDIKHQDKISVYPNPSNGIINIELPLTADCQISITDINGRLVLNKRLINPDVKMQLNLQNEPAGIYLISVMANGQIFEKKIVIK